MGLGPGGYNPGVIDERALTTRVPLWAWPTVLALDAPLVAVSWQLAFAQVFAVALAPGAPLLLGLSVWLAYSADRVLDSFRLSAGGRPTLRHAFAAARRRSLLGVWLATVALATVLAFATLDPATLALSLLLALGAALYLLSIHLRSHLRLRRRSHDARSAAGRAISRRVQHLQVGLLFAAGVALFAWPQIEPARWLPALSLFAALCAINCGYVERWERSLDDGRSGPRRRNDFGTRQGQGLQRSALLLATLALVAFAISGTALYLAIALGALALCSLDRRTAGLDPTLLRTLADTALVLPLIIVPVLAL